MHTCTCAHTDTCTRTDTCLRAHAHARTPAYVHTRTHGHVHTLTRTDTCLRAHARTRAYVHTRGYVPACAHAHARALAYVHTHAREHVHTCTRTCTRTAPARAWALKAPERLSPCLGRPTKKCRGGGEARGNLRISLFIFCSCRLCFPRLFECIVCPNESEEVDRNKEQWRNV